MATNSSVSEDGVDSTEPSPEDDSGGAEGRRSSRVISPSKGGRRRLPIAVIVLALVAAAAVAGVVLSSGSSKPKARATPTTTLKPAPGFTNFVDQKAGFSLSYPQSWKVVKSNDPAVPLLLNIGVEGLDTLLVRVVTLQTSVDTSSVPSMKAFTDAVISGSNVTVFQQQSFNVHGTPGYYYFYSLPKDAATGVTLVHSHFFVFPPQQMVSLTFQTIERDFQPLAGTFDQVVASLRILPR